MFKNKGEGAPLVSSQLTGLEQVHPNLTIKKKSSPEKMSIKSDETRIREIRHMAHYLKTEIPKRFDHGLAFREFLRSRAFVT